MADRELSDQQILARWRLALGKYASAPLNDPSGRDARADRALDYLYGREYRGRGLRGDGDGPQDGSLGPSNVTIPVWLDDVRTLFPRDVCETIERHALDRYGLTELVTDPHVLETLAPSEELLRVLLAFRGRLGPAVEPKLRAIIRAVVDDIRRRMESDVRRAMAGRINRRRHGTLAAHANFDPVGSIRKNLKNYDRERGAVVLERVLFFERNTRRLPWDVILCVDQSGSMAQSLLHAVVMAGILAGMPALRLRFVVFDTSVVDLTDRCDDPIELLMKVQLGGGTNIGQALAYCEQLVEIPSRTILALLTDFFEGAPVLPLIATVQRLVAARVRLIGLAALDANADPTYDRSLAQTLADNGMEIAALTPSQFARWLAGVVG